MPDKSILGGYPIEGDPEENDWLWFTGAKWTPIPYGTTGDIVELVTAPNPNTPFASNGYIVTIEDLKPGQILMAVCTFNEEANRYHEYITNCKCPDWVIGADDVVLNYTAYNGLEVSNTKSTNQLNNKIGYDVGDSQDNMINKSNNASSITHSYSVQLS